MNANELDELLVEIAEFIGSISNNLQAIRTIESTKAMLRQQQAENEALKAHPVKELTDKEIEEVWNKVLAEPPYDGTADRIGNFARAILRKAQEK